MPDDLSLDRDLLFEVRAAELRLELLDRAADLHRLADRLQRLLPEYVQCEYTPSSTSRLGPLRALTVTLADEVLVLRAVDGQVRYQSVHRVHGIDLSHQEISQQVWVERLIQAVADQTTLLAQRSDQDRLL
ncbi:hypothetical protein Q0M94_14845 [Deinococcus radiomollis]|uniref:hypothetical protein n=1 Tax=Deinococcus radiomollis TaxID=468916 RepID=UPI003891CF48